MRYATITFPIFGEGFALNFMPYFTLLGFRIHWYGVLIALGLLLGAVYALWRSKEFGLTQDNVLDFLLYAVPMAVICARLFFVVFQPEVYFRDPLRIVTGIRAGGLSIYGALMGALLGAYLCSRIKKLNLWSFMDVGAFGLLIGQSIGRWGNFANRELFGIPTSLPWRMGLSTGGETLYVHPTFLYESLWNILGLVLLHIYSKKVGRKYEGQIFLFYLGWYGLGRAWIEALRDPSQNMYLFDVIPVNMVLAIACFVGAIVINHLILSRQNRNKPKEA